MKPGRRAQRYGVVHGAGYPVASQRIMHALEKAWRAGYAAHRAEARRVINQSLDISERWRDIVKFLKV